MELALKDRLPPGWSLRSVTGPRRGQRWIDAIWRLRAPNGETVEFAAEVRRTVLPRSLPETVEQLRAAVAQTAASAEPVVVAAYLSPRAQEVLTEQGVSFADTTGNIWLVAARPGLFILATGALKDPWPVEKTLRTLRGRGAGRAVRAIVDFRPPYGLRRARARRPGPSFIGNLVPHNPTARPRSPPGPRLQGHSHQSRLGRRDSPMEPRLRVPPLQPRHPLPRALRGHRTGRQARKASWQHAVTGAQAAQGFAPVTVARTAAVYAIDTTGAAERLGLRPTDSGANVWLAEPFDPVVFDRAAVRGNLVCVNPSQLAADLLTGPGREPSEGEELLEWMKDNEDAWRG